MDYQTVNQAQAAVAAANDTMMGDIRLRCEIARVHRSVFVSLYPREEGENLLQCILLRRDSTTRCGWDCQSGKPSILTLHAVNLGESISRPTNQLKSSIDKSIELPNLLEICASPFLMRRVLQRCRYVITQSNTSGENNG